MREYLLTLCVTAAVTYLLVGPVRKFAIAAGAVPPVRARDVHREPTPRLGGIAMFGGLCAGLLVASQLTNIGDVFTQSDEPRALLAGAGIIWLLGVLDDKWGVDALVKLGGQMIAAGVMVWQGLTILWLPIPTVGMVAITPLQGTLLTVALVVVTINAVNFVDGLDGLAAGMVCLAAMAFFMYAYRIWYSYGISAAAPATLFAAVLMGVCIGFLPHNMHPARIFMGDSGSMLIGLVLAAGAVSITGQVDPDALKLFDGSEKAAVQATVPVYIPLLLPLTILAVPLADLILAIVRRTWNGQSPFAADRGHLHHRLLEIGHSHSRAVLIMYFWSALIAFGAVAFSVRQSASMVIVLTIMLLSAAGLVVLLLPRFNPRVPMWAQRLVPPRYRLQPAPSAASTTASLPAGTDAEAEPAAPAESAARTAGLNGSTAVGERHRFTVRRKIDSPS
ncbi:MraY family glycosyltransferase [Streptomyces alkaliterrae]|uniref:Undecaprenyl/decaprenyl-phosphate alpha-N-acetylglucosaminyl 1-phosphate transferase n=1 Tax=Streptomyces alkaliterrae TaxID=2213162 RepID=A0A5P0YMN8_9ACTN|nr:MraY family glycosyltransferase [Streptomyces alkaliterrae]MBB1254947.1 undecaprenyl/decaprenyl-phosphate alpha-N-acetylglucosaminyl 1-phosphate transferase [Streptomyces alkaliterrae]MBB1261265.1 undecaprenyl/decaprenyl-phosphate alpha-N-acetylglucosaminyl 1-phosphate transferase [Streptomyces alkaliterrae]MQS01531.1 undecaprenyl/decaprenyl-phosphate alpha-N-acetylglucosaminyl 1-phosphate transferase [Streptomyces alkaliterrae]